MINFTIFSDNIDYALGWMVIHSLWQATLIAIVSGILMIALRKKSAHIRYIVANVALFTVFVAATVTFCFHYDFNNQSPQILSNQSFNVIDESIAKNGISLLNATSEDVSSDNLLNISNFKDYFNEHLPLIVTLWLFGAALFLMRLLGSVSYIYYLKSRMNFPTDEYWTEMMQKLSVKSGLKRTVDLVESAMVRTPMVVGHLKPMILFPMGMINKLTPEEVEGILAHELAHVIRHDYVFNIIQSIVEALFYYHPAVWWLSTQIRNERESACDDIAINLINSKMNYAKALVSIQEMAYYPMNMALGFAGQRKNQFMMRMQRILNLPQNKTPVMEKLIATLLIICTLFGLTFGQRGANKKPDLSKIEQQDDSFIQVNSDRPLSMAGVWQATIENNEVCVVFNSNSKGNNWSSTECFNKKDFSELPTVEKEFTITREAGTMTMKGKFEGNEGYGRFTFAENAGFKSFLETQGITGLKESTILHCFLADMNKSFIGFLKEKGYNNITKRQLEELAIFRFDEKVLTEYLELYKKSSVSNPPLNKLVELKIHGIDKEYIGTLQKYGFVDVPVDQILQARIHGIDVDYLDSYVRNKKDRRYSLQDLIQMKIHGADGDYVAKLEGNTGKTLESDEVVNAKIHNIDKIDVDKIEKSTSNKLTNDDLTSFAIHGIDADYINSVNNMGLGKLSNDDIVTAKIHGITPEFIKEYTTLGFKKLNFDDIVTAKIHGINADAVRKFKEMGFTPKFDDVVSAKIHGLTPEYLQKLKDSGFKDITFDDAIGFKIQNVSPELVKGFKDAGFKDLSMDDFMACKIHGVTPQYIKSFEAVGLKNLDIEDAISFKIHGVTPEFVKSLKDKGYEIDSENVLDRKIRGNSSRGGGNSFGGNNPKVNVNLDKIDLKLDKINVNIDEKAIEKSVGKAVSGSSMGAFLKLLVKDNLVQFNKQVIVKANKNWLSIDGKKLDDAIFQKYRQQVESKNGKPLSNQFRFGFEGKILGLEGDSLITKGSIETDGN